jgi:preprotein translocase subunit SecD
LNRVAELLNKRLPADAKASPLDKDQLQITVSGHHDKAFVDRIKAETGAHCVEFRVLANRNFKEDKEVISAAESLAARKNDVIEHGEKTAEWVPYKKEEFGDASDARGGLVKRSGGGVPEILVLMDKEDVRGEYLEFAAKAKDENNGLVIRFRLDEEGTKRLSKLTSIYLPTADQPNSHRQLGLIVDGGLIKAPVIQSVISDSGMISKAAMSDTEVDELVRVLNLGSIPIPIHFVSEQKAATK